MNSPEPPARAPTATTKGRTGLAQRWSALASRLLVCGLILIAGLVFGRQVIQSWRPSPVTPAAPLPNAGAGFESFSLLRFGSAAVELERQTVQGNVDEVIEQLCEAARRSCAQRQPLSAEASDAEAAFLERLQAQSPTLQLGAGAAIYHVASPMPIVAGTANVDGSPVGAATANTRVVSWGLALPPWQDELPTDELPTSRLASESQLSDGLWTLFTIRAADRQATGDDPLPVPRPPDARPVVSLRNSSGMGLATFEGVGGLSEWTQFYDRAAPASWQPLGEWRSDANSARRRFQCLDQYCVEIYLYKVAQPNVSGQAMPGRNQQASGTECSLRGLVILSPAG